MPTLVVWGDSDGIADPDYGRALAAAIPGARFQVLPDTGHLPQLESPQLLLDAVWEFAETQPASRGHAGLARRAGPGLEKADHQQDQRGNDEGGDGPAAPRAPQRLGPAGPAGDVQGRGAPGRARGPGSGWRPRSRFPW